MRDAKVDLSDYASYARAAPACVELRHAWGAGIDLAKRISKVPIRISRREREGQCSVIVEGTLKAADVCALERACLQAGTVQALDLSDLLYADATGVELLVRLAARGMELGGASPYLQLLMSNAGRRALGDRSRLE